MRRLVPVIVVVLLASCSHLGRDGEEREREFDAPDEAAAFEAMKRGVTETTDVGALYRKARTAIEAMPLYSTQQQSLVSRDEVRAQTTSTARTLTSWTSLGPGNIGGRTRALVFDPVDPRIIYAAAVSGGVFKTTDAGAHWTATGDLMANLAVNSLAIDPADRFTLYAGTGEGYFRETVRGTALTIRGDGIFVSHDGGNVWTQSAATASSPDFQFVNDIAISPNDTHTIYAATRTGVWRSHDKAITWSHVLTTTVKGGCTDLALRNDAGHDMAFAACGIFEQATVYRTTDAAADGTWAPVLTDPKMSRTTLAIAPSAPNVIYALAASNDPGPSGQGQDLLAVYRSDQSGASGTWTVQASFDLTRDRLASSLLSNALGGLCGGTTDGWSPMGWHCNVIAVDPTNADRVFAAGVDVFRSDDGGRTWGEASYWWPSTASPAFVHADQHVIALAPGWNGTTNQSLYVANDGGVYRTDNALATVSSNPCGVSTNVAWTTLNHGFGATQFYHGSIFPDGQHYGGGAQDNGSLFGSVATGSEGWQRTLGGDGAYVVVDPSDQRNVFAESQYAALVRSTNSGVSFHTTTLNGAGDKTKFLFVAPVAVDEHAPAHVWVGGSLLFRSDDRGVTFRQVSTPLPSMVSALAIAPGSSDTVLAGAADGHIYRSTAATTASVQTSWPSSQPRSGYVSSITFDPTNPAIAFATYAGFGDTHVWKSNDGGVTWAANDGSGDGALPDLPVHCLVFDPVHANRLYIGTDLGVFVSLDGGAHWMVEAGGFGNVITTWLTTGNGPNGPAIYAFTHGRGAWRADLIVAAPRRRAAR